MHAVVVEVAISDLEKARRALYDEVIPHVRAVPGFVTGFWLAPVDDRGLALLVFESEDAARKMLVMLHPLSHPAPFITIEGSELREVIGRA